MARIIQGGVTVELDAYEVGLVRKALRRSIDEGVYDLIAEDQRAEELLKVLDGQ